MKTMDLSIKRIQRFIRQALRIIRTRFSTQEVFLDPANRELLRHVIQQQLPEKDMKVVYPHAIAAVESVADTKVLEALKQKFPNADIDKRPTGLYLSELDFDGQYPRTAVWGQYLTSLGILFVGRIPDAGEIRFLNQLSNVIFQTT